MSRTNIDIDDELVAEVMRRYDLKTKKDAVDFALHRAAPRVTTDELLALEGIGWEGDLDQMRNDPPDRKWHSG